MGTRLNSRRSGASDFPCWNESRGARAARKRLFYYCGGSVSVIMKLSACFK